MENKGVLCAKVDGIETLIAAVSGEGGNQRWKNLRLVSAEVAGRDVLIPLDNDGTPAQQLKGLTKWCQRFADKFDVSLEDASLVALAYVARKIKVEKGAQVQVENRLLNEVDQKSREDKRDNLEKMIDLFDLEGRPATIFSLVAVEQTGEKKEEADKIKALLRVANASFYLETAVHLLVWARTGVEAFVGAIGGANQDACRQEVFRTVHLLAANAYGNNFAKVPPAVSQELMAPLSYAECAVISNARLFGESLARVKLHPSGYSPVTVPKCEV